MMPAPRLLIVADLDYAGGTPRLLDVIGALTPVAADPRVAVQLRAKALTIDRLEVLASAARERLPAAFLVLNGDAALAHRLGYDGVHWPESAIPGRVPGEPRWHSAAVHSLDALERAERAGVSAAVFGAVYSPGSKEGAAAGLDALHEVCAAARIPVIAIGGVRPDHVAACFQAGASGVAAVSGVVGATDPAGTVDRYLDAIEDAMTHMPREGAKP